jgi:DNA-binding HxlR family transcriptional regulator
MNSEDEDLILRIYDLKQVLRADWVGAILILLNRGPQHYSELRDQMTAWSFQDPWSGKKRALGNGVLARTLTRMTEDGLLVRTELPTQWQPAVRYELSERARRLLDALRPVLSWAGENREFFIAAQHARRGVAADAGLRADADPDRSQGGI